MAASALHLAAGVLAAAADEPSKTPFYVAGSLFAVWAVVLSAIGLRQAEFPPSGTIARAVMGLSLVLMLATTSMAVATSTKKKSESKEAAAPAGAPAQTIPLAADPSGQLLFDEKSLVAKPGAVAIVLTNKSTVPHNVTLERDGKKIAASKDIASATTTLTASLAPGAYTFYCSVDSHRQAGMVGKLTVQ